MPLFRATVTSVACRGASLCEIESIVRILSTSISATAIRLRSRREILSPRAKHQRLFSVHVHCEIESARACERFHLISLSCAASFGFRWTRGAWRNRVHLLSPGQDQIPAGDTDSCQLRRICFQKFRCSPSEMNGEAASYSKALPRRVSTSDLP